MNKLISYVLILGLLAPMQDIPFARATTTHSTILFTSQAIEPPILGFLENPLDPVASVERLRETTSSAIPVLPHEPNKSLEDFEVSAEAIAQTLHNRRSKIEGFSPNESRVGKVVFSNTLGRVVSWLEDLSQTFPVLGRLAARYTEQGFRHHLSPERLLAEAYSQRIYEISPTTSGTRRGLQQTALKIWNAWVVYQLSLLSLQTWDREVLQQEHLKSIQSLVAGLPDRESLPDPLITNASEVYALASASLSQNEEDLMRQNERSIALFSDEAIANPFSLLMLHDLGRHLRNLIRTTTPSALLQARLKNAVDYALIIRHAVPLLETYRMISGNPQEKPAKRAILEALIDAFGGDPEYLLDEKRLSELNRDNAYRELIQNDGGTPVERERFKHSMYPENIPEDRARFFSLLNELASTLATDIQSLSEYRAVLDWKPGKKALFYSPLGRSNLFSYDLWQDAVFSSMLWPNASKGRRFEDFNSASMDPAILKWMQAVDSEGPHGAHDPELAKAVLEDVIARLDTTPRASRAKLTEPDTRENMAMRRYGQGIPQSLRNIDENLGHHILNRIKRAENWEEIHRWLLEAWAQEASSVSPSRQKSIARKIFDERRFLKSLPQLRALKSGTSRILSNNRLFESFIRFMSIEHPPMTTEQEIAGMKIGLATLEDLKEIVRLDHEAFDSFEDLTEEFEIALKQNNARRALFMIMTAKSPQGQLMGMIMAERQASAYQAEIHEWAVNTRYRGKGVARGLFTAICKTISEKWPETQMAYWDNEPDAPTSLLAKKYLNVKITPIPNSSMVRFAIPIEREKKPRRRSKSDRSA